MQEEVTMQHERQRVAPSPQRKPVRVKIPPQRSTVRERRTRDEVEAYLHLNDDVPTPYDDTFGSNESFD